MSEDETDGESNRPRRKSLLTKAILWKAGQEFASVRVRNLSREGLGGEASTEVTAGGEYLVELRGVGKVSGRIAWVDGTRFGMRFDREINLEALEMASPAEVKLADQYGAPRSFEPVSDYRRPGFHTRK